MNKNEVLADLERLKRTFQTTGSGTVNDRVAGLLLQQFDVLERRLVKPDQLRLLYSLSITRENTPACQLSIIDRFLTGEIGVEKAREELASYRGEYEKVFREQGINPETPTGIHTSQMAGVPSADGRALTVRVK